MPSRVRYTYLAAYEMKKSFGFHKKHLFVLQFKLVGYEQRESLHGGLKLLLWRDAEGRPQVLAGLVRVRLEGAAGHEHDVTLQPPLHGHVPGGGQARHTEPEEHSAL